MEKNNTTFGSKFGTLVVVAGSVIGLGNIWRFPYLAGNNGGSAFILMYVICSLTISVPIMISEFVIGRSTKSNAFRAFKTLSHSKVWSLVGLLGIFTVFIIFGYYSIIAGWALSFFQTSITSGFTGKDVDIIHSDFINYINSGWKPTLAALVFISLTAGVVIGGVKKGIEKINKVLMPVLALILIILFLYSTSLSGFSQAVDFLLKPDFSKIGFKTILAAIGQSFFSMSLGMGCMITYGAYIKQDISLPKLAIIIAIADLCVAMIAGFAIFPGVFTFGIEPTSGPTLVFETLPLVFSKMTGGNIFGFFFFFLVFIAAITSSVSMLEPMVLFIMQETKLSRKKSVLSIILFVVVLAVLCAYSQVENSSIKLFGMNLFDALNNATDKIMMPIGALLIIIFIGWFSSKSLAKSQITNNNLHFIKGFNIYFFMVRYIIPLVLSLFILNLFGILDI